MVNTSRMFMLVVAAVAFAAQALAGVTFRLDIGPAVADTSAGKVKNAVLLVRPLACDDPASVVMTGTAEGIVNGARQSVALKLQRLPTPGVHAVSRQWPDGDWVLNLTATCPGRDATASAVVPLRGPSGFVRAKAQFFDHSATVATIEASLKGVAQAD
jgi:hypothetical protein